MFQKLLTKVLVFFFILGTTSYVDAQSGRIKKRKKKTTPEVQKPKPKPKKPKKRCYSSLWKSGNQRNENR